MPPASRMQAGLAAGVTDESDSYSSSDETDSLSSPFRATFIANADDSRYSQQSNAPAQQSRTKTGSSNAPTSRLTRQFSAAESASIVSKSTKSVVAFNARDAITGHPLLDPVLGSDGLIHDRWSLLDFHDCRKRPFQILGDVIQLKDAILSAHPERRQFLSSKRSSYRATAIDMCTSTDHNKMEDCITMLSDVLLWKKDDVEILTRRAVLRYRLRLLEDAKHDLDRAISISTASPAGVPSLDSLRYRGAVHSEIRDFDSALLDIEKALAQAEHDPLSLSLRAMVKAGKGDFEEAESDLQAVAEALETGQGSQSSLANETRDMDLCAKGWAHSSLGDISAALQAFQLAQSLRPFDPYTTACTGIAYVHMGLQLQSEGAASEANDRTSQGIAELTSAVGVVMAVTRGGSPEAISGAGCGKADSLSSSRAYDAFFLRGMAYFALEEFEASLSDFEVAQKIRPSIMKSTGEFHCMLAILLAETGQSEEAAHNFDMAMALKPDAREAYLSKRIEYGL